MPEPAVFNKHVGSSGYTHYRSDDHETDYHSGTPIGLPQDESRRPGEDRSGDGIEQELLLFMRPEIRRLGKHENVHWDDQ